MKYVRLSAISLFLLVLFFASPRPTNAMDVWTQVRSKNFLLVGNASEKDIRKVGTKLEEFRETFRLLFGGANLTSAIPTNVIVFKSDSSFKNFKPKRGDVKIDTFVAGYFQPGEDVNYISLSAEGDGSGDATKYGVIFHEYVHFIVNTNFGKSDVPPWFNEGLAEYYETFAIEADQKVKLGLPQPRHLELLNANKLIPLETLFSTTNRQLLQSGDHSRSIFYAESWALIHYLIQGGKADALNKFLNSLVNKDPPQKAFQDAFLINYAAMEVDLRRYVSQNSYPYRVITLPKKLTFDDDMKTSILDESDSNAYLGDLLYHLNRADNAEPLLVDALKLAPHSSMANTTLGMVKLRQRKFDEARKYLETAMAGDPKNHIAYFRYAYLLSREGRDEFGYVSGFPKETADKIRQVLQKAIEINPSFTESYELLAFINLISNENLDESIALLQTALKFQPGNQRYALRIAEIELQQKKFDAASLSAKRIAATTDDTEIKGRADNLLAQIGRLKQFSSLETAQQKTYEEAVAAVQKGAEVADDPDVNLRTINRALRKPRPDEMRTIGSVQKIDCKTRPLTFTIKTPTETFSLNSPDFESLTLNAFIPEANQAQVGCDENMSAFHAVITYKPATGSKNSARGELVAIEFVNADFRFLMPSDDRVAISRRENETLESLSGTLLNPPPAKTPEGEARQRDLIMRTLNDGLRKPAEGQKREVGYLEKIECTPKGAFFIIKTPSKTLRLLNLNPQSLKIGVYAPDLAEMQFGCAIKPVEFPAVFIFVDKSDAKTKSDGEIISIEFVPKSFVLQ